MVFGQNLTTLNLRKLTFWRNSIKGAASWWLNHPNWKICSSNCIISPGFGVNIQKIFELPPPSLSGLQCPIAKHKFMREKFSLIGNPWIIQWQHQPRMVCLTELPLVQHGFGGVQSTSICFFGAWKKKHLPNGGENTVIYRGIIYVDLLFWCLEQINKFLPNGGEKNMWFTILYHVHWLYFPCLVQSEQNHPKKNTSSNWWWKTMEIHNSPNGE